MFGALHDQISYTVSPEYFTHFKFHQFAMLQSEVPERVRVAAVGFLASWWMGLPLGLLAGLGGFIHSSDVHMRRALWWSLPLIVVFTLGVALTGLVYGYVQTERIDVADYPGWFPNGVGLRGYLCAGYMHNAAYLGGLGATLAAWIFHVIVWHRTR